MNGTEPWLNAGLGMDRGQWNEYQARVEEVDGSSVPGSWKGTRDRGLRYVRMNGTGLQLSTRLEWGERAVSSFSEVTN